MPTRRESAAKTATALLLVALLPVLTLMFASGASAQEEAPAASGPARDIAPIDLTGQWVAIISEDWRWRMVTPARGDFPSIPLNLDAQLLAEAWDPAADEAAGEACKAYGAPGLMRGPTRLRISWLDADTLQLDSDYGMQTRLFHFDGAFSEQSPMAGTNTWQGESTAEWIMAGQSGFGSMKTVTTELRPGYLRKNGVPYSDSTVYTEFWDVHVQDNGDRYLVVTNKVEDPVYLQLPWLTAIHFKKEDDPGRWDPTPCDARF
ncbi:MAG: hypothetical protein F4053_17115 [Proteobacteria bacterium]|nr:hypothetical protein [Pseudomonadota bacterium]